MSYCGGDLKWISCHNIGYLRRNEWTSNYIRRILKVKITKEVLYYHWYFKSITFDTPLWVVRSKIKVTWWRTSKIVTNEHPIQSPRIPPTLATNHMTGIFWSFLITSTAGSYDHINFQFYWLLSKIYWTNPFITCLFNLKFGKY